MEFEPEVEEFLSSLKPNTRRAYGRALYVFQGFLAEKKLGTIDSFLSEVEEDQRRPRREKTRVDRKTLNAFVGWLVDKGCSPHTISLYTGAIQALGKYYDVSISLRYVNRPPVKAIHKKHPWTLEEVAKFVGLMDNIQYKSIATAIFQSGLSISDLLSLTYGDIRAEFEKDIAPLCLDLSRKKTNVPFMTFLGDWALQHLKQHLQGRKLDDSTPIYTITSRAVDIYFARVGRKFGEVKGRNPYSPHSLRAAFDTILRDHKVDHLYVEFWMGHHVPDQQMVYISKSREGWRETYRTQAEPWLTPKEL